MNVAVAWGCAAWVRLGPSHEIVVGWCDDSNLPTGRGWKLRRYSAFGTTRVVAMVRTSRGSDKDHAPLEVVVPRWSGLIDAALRQSADSRAGRNVHPSVIYDDARGWPVRALRCRWDHGVISGPQFDGIALPPAKPNAPGEVDIQSQRGLPLSPYWPGFGVDVLFYATLLWLLSCMAIAVRRFIRLRRGLCPLCKYPIGLSAVCTECGQDLPKRVRPAT